MTTRAIPTDTMPALEAELAGGGTWRLAAEHAQTLELLVFYRGLHCPICRSWIAGLERLLPEIETRGVSVIALSCDPRDYAERAKRDWGLARLRVGYALDHEDARKAGLYLSEGRGRHVSSGIEEPRVFVEPGVLAVRPDGTLYMAWVQSTPYAPPNLMEILAAIDNMIVRGLPAPRGAA